MRNWIRLLLIGYTLLLTECKNDKSVTKMEQKIEKQKRDKLVSKYDLLNFPNIKSPVLFTIDEFFDGNNDDASIAPNLNLKPKITEYYKVLKSLSNSTKVIDAFVEIKEVLIYENGQLHDNEWFYTDIIYFIGDITTDEIREATKSLLPDEVEYDTENKIITLSPKYKGKKVVYIWWD